MRRLAWIAAVVIATTAAATARPDAEPTGTWLLSYTGRGTASEFNICILKVESKDGRPTASVVAAPKGQTVSVKEIKVAGDRVSVVLGNGTFFTGVAGKDKDVVLGGYGNDSVLFRAKLTRTEKDEIASPVTPGKQPAEMAEIAKVASKANLLRFKAQQTKEPEEKKALLAEAAAAAKEADEKLPGLYRDFLKANPDHPVAADTALTMLAGAGKFGIKADEARALVKMIAKRSADYGPDYARFVTVQAAEGIAGVKGLEVVAADTLRPIVKTFTDKEPAANAQVKVLTALKTALTPAGGDELKEVDGKLTKLETVLDEEYHKTVPPFTPTKFDGRKDSKANRAVVMELFTGAQCPPCVAADVAFDALGKSYHPKDLVLIQYHMHIPGPDPMTNKDTIARWDYYSDKFPGAIRGTPSTLFNGTPKAGGGGGMTNAEKKYGDYTSVINPLLEESTPIKLSGRATRAGDKVEIAVEYNGVPTGGEAKLRLLLVEDTVKYVGGNKLRFHHAVVRSMPGGAAGTALKDKAGKQTTLADVAKVRADLNKYLDEYAAERPFPSAARPLEMTKLQVIALVQDDASGEILHAARFDVTPRGPSTE
ncbi:hypothetical protein J0H58_34040 [bacterium]|nr:hypothetical protein [bacterium]